MSVVGWFVILLPYLELRLSLIISNPKFVRPLKIATIGYQKKCIDEPSEEIVIVWMTQRSLLIVLLSGGSSYPIVCHL